MQGLFRSDTRLQRRLRLGFSRLPLLRSGLRLPLPLGVLFGRQARLFLSSRTLCCRLRNGGIQRQLFGA